MKVVWQPASAGRKTVAMTTNGPRLPNESGEKPEETWNAKVRMAGAQRESTLGWRLRQKLNCRQSAEQRQVFDGVLLTRHLHFWKIIEFTEINSGKSFPWPHI